MLQGESWWMWLHKDRLDLLPTAQTGCFLQRAGAELSTSASGKRFNRRVKKIEKWVKWNLGKVWGVVWQEAGFYVKLLTTKFVTALIDAWFLFLSQTDSRYFLRLQIKLLWAVSLQRSTGAVKYFSFFFPLLRVVILLTFWPSARPFL